MTGYDDRHPDDRRRENHSFLLFASERAVGAARLDCHDTLGIVGTVAILPDFQRKGFGRALMDGLERRARALALRSPEVNAAPDAVAFYETLGWTLFDRQNPRMAKCLASWPRLDLP